MAPQQRRLPLNSDGVQTGDLHDTALNYFCEGSESPSRHVHASPPPSRFRAFIGAAAVLWVCATVWAMTTNIGMEGPVDVAQMRFTGEADVASVWRAPPPSHTQQQPPAKAWWDSEMMDPDPAAKGSSAEIVCSGCDMEAHVAFLKNGTLPPVLAAHAAADVPTVLAAHAADDESAPSPKRAAAPRGAGWPAGLAPFTQADLQAWQDGLSRMGEADPEWAQRLLLALLGTCAPAAAPGPTSAAPLASALAGRSVVDQQVGRAACSLVCALANASASTCGACPECSPASGATGAPGAALAAAHVAFGPGVDEEDMKAFRRYEFVYNKARGDVARWTEAGTPVPPEACIGPEGETLTLRQIYDVALRGGGRSGPKRYVEAIVSTKPAARHCAVAGAAGGIALRASARSDVGLQGSILREFGGGKYAGYLLPVESGDFVFELGWADGRAADAAGDAPFELQLHVAPNASAPPATTSSTPPPLCTSLAAPALALNGRWVGDDWAPFRCYLAPVTQPLLRRCAAGAPLHLLLVGGEPMREVFSWLGRALLGAEWGVQLGGGEQGGRQQASGQQGGSQQVSSNGSSEGLSVTYGTLRLSWVRWSLDATDAAPPPLPSPSWIADKSAVVALVGSSVRGAAPAALLIDWVAGLGVSKVVWLAGTSELADSAGGCDGGDCALSASRRQAIAAADADALGGSMPVLDAWRLGGVRRPPAALNAAVGTMLANYVCNPRVWPALTPAPTAAA